MHIYADYERNRKPDITAAGVRRVRPSYSGEHMGGLVESSSAESFVSNKSEDPGVEDHPPRGSLSGLVF